MNTLPDNMKQSTFFKFSIGNDSYSVDITKELEEYQHQNMTHIPKTPKHIYGIDGVKAKIMSIIKSTQSDIQDIEIQNSKITTVFETKNQCRRAIHTPSNNKPESIVKANNLNKEQTKKTINVHETNFIMGEIAQKECFNLMVDFISNELSEFETTQ